MAVYDAVVRAIDEDLPSGEDVTSTATIPVTEVAVADFEARADGVVAGLAVAELVFRYVVSPDVVVTRLVADGARVERGDVLMTVEGSTGLLLTAERTALNFLSHLSGVATTTAAWVAALDGPGAKVRDTRKTLPGYRLLEKYAVRCGGGVNHRTSLSDQALIKDNHVLATGGVVEAYDAVRRAYPDLPVQVEVTTLDQLRACSTPAPNRCCSTTCRPPSWPRRCRSTPVARHWRPLAVSRSTWRRRSRRRASTSSPSARSPTPRRFSTSRWTSARRSKSSDRVMILCADIGNSHTVLGLVEDGKVVDHWRVSTLESRTADEWGLLVRGLLRASVVQEPVIGIAVCATVPAVLHEWREMLRAYFGDVNHVVVEPGVRTGVPVLMDNPREVGTDRIINALAAAHLYDGPCIVVDFGTATTFDVVSPKGEYVGGAIAPGIEISLEALGRRGAQLRKVELLRPRSVIAKNTVEALQSGVIFGFASQVDGIVTRMIAELKHDPADVNVIATGGLAPVVVDESSVITDHQPWLTLLGLEIVFGRNS